MRSIHANIKKELLKNLDQAKSSIYAAIAWFTDEDIFNILCQKAALNVEVQIILHNDLKESNSINFSRKGLDFSRLHFCGAEIFLLKGHHNKYCIIDSKTYLSGSYNWTFGASMKQDGFESLEIYEDEDLAKSKQLAFNQLLSMSSGYTELIPKVSLPRMEIKNLIFIDFKPVSSHFIQAVATDSMGKNYLKFYIPGSFRKTSIEQVAAKNEENGTLSISPDTHFVIFEKSLWLLPKKKT